MRRLRLCFSALFLAMLTLPLLQRWCAIVPEQPLGGVEEPARGEPLGFATFFSGAWQKGQAAEFTHHLGLRPILVRTDNQIGLSLLGELKPPRYLGTKEAIFDREYHPATEAHTDSPQELLTRLVEVRDLHQELDKRGVRLVVVLSPSKTHYLRDEAPALWQPYLRDRSLPRVVDLVHQTLVAAKVPTIDFGAWFEAQRPRAAAPLFSQGGVHWSVYGSALAGAELLKVLAALCDKPYPTITVTGATAVEEPPDSDDDLTNLANIWDTARFRGTPFEPTFDTRHPDGHVRARLLIVGTSFAWNLTSLYQRQSACSDLEVWYYHRTRCPIVLGGQNFTGENTPLEPEKLDYGKEFARFDAVVLESPPGTVPRIGHGFAKQALAGLRAAARK